jgi:hypothetical protein
MQKIKPKTHLSQTFPPYSPPFLVFFQNEKHPDPFILFNNNSDPSPNPINHHRSGDRTGFGECQGSSRKPEIPDH